MIRGMIAAAALMALTGCASTFAEPRVRSALIANGVGEADAACMARRMVDRLSVAQLKRLKQLGPRKGEPERPDDVRAFLARIGRIGDPEVIAVTASSAALCVSGLAREAR